MPEGAETYCSGCNLSPAPGSASVYYSCWQCNFQLHEQCFQATRSMNHASHPSHPLTLIPYPTYPSGSFLCNSCNLTGTGFSYSCSHCEFDLHLHCSYINPAATPSPNYSLSPTFISPQYTCPPNEAMRNVNQPIYDPRLPDFSTENQPQKLQKVKHFSHHHALHLSEIQEEDYVLCSACDEYLSGSAYSCPKPRCKFNLHRLCFELPREIQHKFHPNHALTLLTSPPNKEEGEFTCSACRLIGTAFTYHCKACKFDLHVKCATLAETIERQDHEHPLALLYSSPYKKAVEENSEEPSFYCDVCQDEVGEGCWVYFCRECDFGADLRCATAEEEEAEDDDESRECLDAEYSLAEAQQKMKLLQLQMQLAKQNAEFVISCGQSFANLA